MTDIIISVQNVNKHYVTKKRRFKPDIMLCAANNVSFQLNRGEVLGLVGASGCGKSTIAKMLVKLLDYDSGSITFDGKELSKISQSAFRTIRPSIQLVQQNPFNCMDPKCRIIDTLSEGVLAHKIVKSKAEAEKYLMDILEACELERAHFFRYPCEFSGGQLQRLAIARAIALKPEVLIADEIVSALDISVQEQILQLLMRLKRERNQSILFISHDLAVIQKVSDRVVIMKDGGVVDAGSVDYIFNESKCDYTKTLLSAIIKFPY